MRPAGKHLLLFSLTIALIGGAAVYATYRLYSNVAGPITLSNSVTIYTYSVYGSYITSYAQVTGNPYAGVTVYFWESTTGNGTPDSSPGDWNYIGSNVTDGSGYTQFTWTAPSNGNYYFIAGFDVP